jgi:hypothetical protein
VYELPWSSFLPNPIMVVVLHISNNVTVRGMTMIVTRRVTGPSYNVDPIAAALRSWSTTAPTLGVSRADSDSQSSQARSQPSFNELYPSLSSLAEQPPANRSVTYRLQRLFWGRAK